VNQFVQIVQSDLAKIGITASIEILEAAQATANTQQGTFSDLFALLYAYGDQDPALLFTAPPFRPVGNSTRFDSNEYRNLVAAARREPDWDKRLGLYRQIATFVKDQAFVLPLATRVVPWVTRSNVHGVSSSKGTSPATPLLEGMWVD
jgi:peptide/nickel transport system substrate-binding protein